MGTMGIFLFWHMKSTPLLDMSILTRGMHYLIGGFTHVRQNALYWLKYVCKKHNGTRNRTFRKIPLFYH